MISFFISDPKWGHPIHGAVTIIEQGLSVGRWSFMIDAYLWERLMGKIWSFIKGLKTIHKVVIFLFCVSLVFTVNQQIVEYDNLSRALSDSAQSLCERDHPSDQIKFRSCMKNKIPNRLEERTEYILTTSLVFLLLHALVFPMYVIFYNGISFIRDGYFRKYNFKEMRFYQKILHSFGLVYLLLLSIVSYGYIDNIMVERVVPIVHLNKLFSQNWENEIDIEGVWVKDRPPYEGYNTENVGESFGKVRSISSVSIRCNKQTMECTQRDITVTNSGGTKFLGISDQDNSTITSWTNDYLTSEKRYDCYVDSYKFDLTAKKGSWTRTPVASKVCQDRNIEGGDYTLWDGLDLHGEMEAGESGRLIKVIRSIFAG